LLGRVRGSPHTRLALTSSGRAAKSRPHAVMEARISAFGIQTEAKL